MASMITDDISTFIYQNISLANTHRQTDRQTETIKRRYKTEIDREQ